MESTQHRTASYKGVAGTDGVRFQFFCAISGALLHTTELIWHTSPEQALGLAWEQEGRAQFNRCHKCGRWVSDVMYNADVLECVECSP